MIDQKFKPPKCRDCRELRWWFVTSPSVNKYIIECKNCGLQQSTNDVNAMYLANKPKPKTWRDK